MTASWSPEGYGYYEICVGLDNVDDKINQNDLCLVGVLILFYVIANIWNSFLIYEIYNYTTSVTLMMNMFVWNEYLWGNKHVWSEEINNIV